MFDINYFNENPNPFYLFAKELLPGKYYPTLGHYFLNLLNKKKLLQRIYTQNIDTLERLAGIPEDKLVECHGNFATAYCAKCKKKYEPKYLEEFIIKQEVAHCTEKDCNGLIKPGIVFFGEELPERFKWLSPTDMMSADLLIIIGTSLNVEPCASLVYQVGDLCPRLLINRDPVGPFVKYSDPHNYRDVFVKDTIDNAVAAFCKEMNWEKDLYKIQNKITKKLNAIYHPRKSPSAVQSLVKLIRTLSPFTPRSDDDELDENALPYVDHSQITSLSSSSPEETREGEKTTDIDIEKDKISKIGGNEHLVSLPISN